MVVMPTALRSAQGNYVGKPACCTIFAGERRTAAETRREQARVARHDAREGSHVAKCHRYLRRSTDAAFQTVPKLASASLPVLLLITSKALAHGGAALPHYGVVWEQRLTRSGMPKNDSGWKWLRSQGVKSIVTFRIEDDVDYRQFGFEHVLRLPISGNPPGDPPSDQQAEEFLRFIQDPNNAPVHMHCTSGRDRTGMMAALARYSIDGWPMEKALEKARSYRHGEDLPPKRMAWLYNWARKHEPGSYRLNHAATRGDRSRAPDGLRYVASWVTEDFRRCFQIMECEDRALLAQWTAR